MIDHRPIKSGRFERLPAHRACVECPLRRTAEPGRLGGYTVQQYLDVLHGIADLACHLSPGFPSDPQAQRSCTGVAQYRANVGVNGLARNAQAAVDHVGPNTSAVFASPREFARHHSGINRMVKR